MHSPSAQRTFVATAGSARAGASAYLRHLHRSPARWAVYAGYVVGLAALTFGGATSVGPDRQDAAVAITFVAATVAAVAAMNLWAYVALLRMTRSSLAPGMRYESGWDDTSFWIRGPLGDGRLLYTAVDRVRLTDEWAFVDQRNVASPSMYPVDLLPDDIAERVASAGRPE